MTILFIVFSSSVQNIAEYDKDERSSTTKLEQDNSGKGVHYEAWIREQIDLNSSVGQSIDLGDLNVAQVSLIGIYIIN